MSLHWAPEKPVVHVSAYIVSNNLEDIPIGCRLRGWGLKGEQPPGLPYRRDISQKANWIANQS